MKEGHGTMMSRSIDPSFETLSLALQLDFLGEEVTMYEWEGKMLSKQLMLAQHIRTNTTCQAWWYRADELGFVHVRLYLSPG